MAYDPEYHRRYYQENKERKRANADAWAKRNPDKVRAMARKKQQKAVLTGKAKEYSRRWETRNKERVLWKAAKNRSAKSGIPFSIEPTDIVIPDRCPVLNIEITRAGGRRMNPNSPSLDKIDPKLGYVPGNVWVISWRANRMKCDASPEELKAFCEGMLRLLK